ncbi:hypothetical protein QGP82_12660 [Leptothoe sp. LEGE 181152]|nr:hypothetical protein [Leptothoe sp. LEGE 181152]
MALAILRWQDTDDDYTHVDIDIGITNRYYRYQIGDEAIRRFNGLKQLEDPTFISPLMGPLPEESLGRKTLEIPNEQFDRKHRYLQLFSFRTAQLEGPALSEIVQIPAFGLQREQDDSHNAVSLSLEDSMPSQTIEQPPVEVVAFSYKEASPVSTAMAFKGLSSVIGGLKKFAPLAKKATAVVTSPQAQNALKQAGTFLKNPQNQQMLMNAGTSLLSKTGLTGQQPMNNQAMMQLLMNFLNQSGMAGTPQMGMMPGAGTMTAMTGANLMGAQQNPMLAAGMFPTQQMGSQLPNSSAVNTAMLAQQQLQKNQLQRFPTGTANRTTNLSRARSFSTAASVPYSDQMALPALAALPSLLGGLGGAGATGGASALMGGANMSGLVTSLMPLLQQVLTPETVQMMMQNISPTKMLGAVTDSVTQVAKVSLEDKKQDQQHIEKLIANADDTAMEKWAYGAAVVNALAWSPEVVDYRRVGRVRLDFTDVTPLMLHGRSRVLYHQDQDIAFPLKLETPRPIRKGILQILVKDPESLEILLEKKYKVDDLTSGPLDVVPTLRRDQLELLEPNEDYLVTVVLAWKGRSRRNPSPRRKKPMGTSMTQMITLMRDYCFDRIEGQSETVALNDVDRYRSYWHKVWQGQLSSRRRRLTLDCKYYYTLERDRTVLARMETLSRIQQTSDTRQEGKLKAGMMLNPERLNELLGQISDHEPLEDEQLNALFNTDNISLFNALARTEVKFKGRKGSTIALWVYPELKIQRILLKQASEIDKNGHVTKLVEAPVYFPMPAKAHFIGVSDDD